MKCREARAAISARYDGEDIGVDSRKLDTHLAGCAECRAEAEAIGVAGTVLRSVAYPVPSAEFDRRVLSSVGDRCWFDRLCDWFECPQRRAMAALAASAVIIMCSLAFMPAQEGLSSNRIAHLRQMAIQSGIDPEEIELYLAPDTRRTEGVDPRCI